MQDKKGASLDLRAIFDAIDEPITVVDTRFRILDHNRSANRLDAPPHGLIGRCCYEVYHGRQDVCPDCAVRESLASGAPASQLCRLPGTQFDREMTAFPVRDARGGIVAVVEHGRDISARVQAEEALKRSESRLRDAQRIAHIGSWEFNLDSRALWWSAETWRIFGLSEHEGPPTVERLLQRVHPQDRQRLLDEIASGESLRTDYRIVRDDGEVRYIREEVVIERDADGQPTIARGTAQDVTAMELSRQALQRNESLIRSIIDNVEEGFVVLDRNLGIITANRAFCAAAGSSLDSIVGRPCYEVSHKTQRPCWELGERCAVRGVFEDGQARTSVHEHHDSQGRRIYVETKAYPLRDSEGRVTAAIEVLNDISERHLLEAERLKTQKLEAIGTLAGGIAHDFNNLLQGVFGHISVAMSLLETDHPAHEMLREADAALVLATGLTSQFLTFSKGGEPTRERTALRPVVETAARFALSGSEVALDLEVDDDLHDVLADSGQLSQVLQNIVINAKDAMNGRGAIHVRCRNLKAGDGPLADEPLQIEISVRDSGVGMTDAQLARIFDPYFTTKAKGNGLGMATAYSIIRHHEGRLSATSTPGEGTTIWLHLPGLVPARPLAPRRPTPIDPLHHSLRVLLMDDEPAVQRVGARMLGRLGHASALAAHGEEALALFVEAREAGAPFDVVVLDLTIKGGLGGAETLQRMLEIDPNVKAIVSSGYAEGGVMGTADRGGFSGRLPKPYSITILKDCLDKVVGARCGCD